MNHPLFKERPRYDTGWKWFVLARAFDGGTLDDESVNLGQYRLVR